MTPCFADTFFFLALLNANDPAYAKARAANAVDRRVLVSAWVLLELADHLCDVANRRRYCELFDAIESDPR